MCGIFGYIGDIPQKRRQEFASFITRLANLTGERGRHATGYAAWHAWEGFSSFKAPMSSSRFIQTPEWKALRNDLPNALVGHTRYSTGTDPKVNKNNHPFVGDVWAIVHNGWLTNYDQVVSDYDLEDALESYTDSEAILGIMETCGDPRIGFEEVLGYVEGAASVAAIHQNTGAVYLFREESKPMCVVRIPYFNAVVFASTESILTRAILGVSRGGRVNAQSHFQRETASAKSYPGWHGSSYYVPAKHRIRQERERREKMNLKEWQSRALESVFSTIPGRLYCIRHDELAEIQKYDSSMVG